MLLLAPPPKLLLLAPPRREIKRGSRVVWNAKGQKENAHYYNRAVPKNMIFTVQEVIEWENGKHSVRLFELKNPTYLDWLEPAPAAR